MIWTLDPQKRRAAVLMAVALTVPLIVGVFVGRCTGPNMDPLLAKQARAQALTIANLEATNDTTRELYLKALHGKRIFEQLVLQLELRADSIDAELNQQSRARVNAMLRLRELETISASGPVTSLHDTIRVAQIAMHDPPYRFDARVELPPPPNPSLWDVSIQLDTIPIGLRLACADGAIAGVREARVQATTPPWATLAFTSVEQATDLCSPPLPPPEPGRKIGCMVGSAGGSVAAVSGHLLEGLVALLATGLLLC